MKMQHLGLLGVYVGLAAWLGFQSADPALAEAFAGQAGGVLFAMLVVLYATVAALTVWIVTLLTRFTYKLAAGGRTPATIGASVVQGLVIVALFSRLPALLGQQFLGTNLGISALAIPLVAAGVVLVRDKALSSGAKAVAFLPFLLYIAADAAVLWNSGQV